MRVDIQALCECDGVALLPMTAPSEGVGTELAVASSIKATVLTVEKWIELSRNWGQLNSKVVVNGNTGRWRER